MFFTVILLLAGFIFLVKGADVFVDGSSSIAKHLRIPSLIIGLTIVAFGTSAPELAVSITAALDGSNALSYGNVIGSNIFNMLMVVGMASIISPQMVQKSVIIKEFPFAIMSCLVLALLSLDASLGGTKSNTISRADGFILLIFFGIFMYYLIESALNSRHLSMDMEEEQLMPKSKSIVYAVAGALAIVIGGKMVVTGSVAIANRIGISESLVGLTIVAIGTSLPELVTSVVAAKKGESDIAMGNAIGSNIFNAFLILGVSTTINPIPLDQYALIDLSILAIVSFITYIFAITKRKISRIEGTILVVIYALYMYYIVLR